MRYLLHYVLARVVWDGLRSAGVSPLVLGLVALVLLIGVPWAVRGRRRGL